MPSLNSPDDAATEKRVWSLMVQDFYWSQDALSELKVRVRSPTGHTELKEVKLQTFEVIVAAVFAQLRPDYDWWVTPNRPDGGVDFIGRGIFLSSRELGIEAAITIGGQCKKRNRVNNVVNELSGSFVRMANKLHPTFFVAALSASLSAKRIADAKEELEHTLQRHCHILDRHQLENLIGANLIAAKPIIRRVYPPADGDHLLTYFSTHSRSRPGLTIQASAPTSVLAGESFNVRLSISRTFISEALYYLKWLPPSSAHSAGTLVSPLGADSSAGAALNFHTAGGDDPFVIEQDLEFVLYAIGPQPLGAVALCDGAGGGGASQVDLQLPTVTVIDNLRPPFYDVPYREAIAEIQRGLSRARSGRVECVAVVGAGGAGKTRLCEEMCLESRRHGAYVVSARQAHSNEFPRRILANLLLGLTDADLLDQAFTTRIDDILSAIEPLLATRARPAIEALCGQAGKPGSFDDDQELLSVLAVLIAQRSRFHTLVIHLHDLHWCTLDVLETIDRLIWQLDNLKIQAAPGAPLSRIPVLFLLEGRMHEHRENAETGWSTRVFERFIERLACPVAQCRSFEDHESAAFARRIFEQAHSATRILPHALLGLQDHLIDTIHQVAGGNPFHMLEQVKLLQQLGILAQNPNTGLIYMMRPDFGQVALPRTVFETIEARWRYYTLSDRSLAVLLWAAALVDDNLPYALFCHLWSRIAPAITQQKLEATEFLRFPQIDHEGQVSFRHENYFQAVRRVQVPEEERRAVVEAYSIWFRQAKRLTPALRYVQARVELKSPSPKLAYVRSILLSAYSAATKGQDRGLTSRVLATLLDDVTWPSNELRPLLPRALIQACDAEEELCNHLAHSGQTDIAYERLQHVLRIVESRLTSSKPSETVDQMWRRRFILLTMQADILFHDRRPAEAVAITDDAVRELSGLVAASSGAEKRKWDPVMMEVYHTHSAAVALAGDLRRAVIEARKAAAIAERLLDKSPDALGAIITYANILLSEDPEESESILRRFAGQSSIRADTRLRLDLNLAMARIVLGYRERRFGGSNTRRLGEAQTALRGVFSQAHPLGRLADAAASALLLGLISALSSKPDDIDWFSQSAALAIRVRQLETLWRAHINLAHSLYRSGQSAHDPAAAALEIMTYSLRSYAEPDRTPRFQLLSVPMAHAVRYLILSRDSAAEKALRMFPELRTMFVNVESGQLKDDRGGRTSHEWLRVDDVDYVIF